MIEYVIGALGLIIASVMDFRSREIEDYIWIFLAVFGILFAIYSSITLSDYSILINSISGFVICFILGYMMFLSGIGGGDGKMLIGLGALVPKFQMPIYTSLGTLLNLNYLPTFPIMVFINGIFFMVFLPFVILFRNILNGARPKTGKDVILMFFGEKMKVKNAKEQKRLIMGQNDKINFFPAADDEDFSKYADEEEIWVTPQIPLIIPITLSYLVTPIIGDRILDFLIPF
ncbi:preflagellin peptidase, Aspartic peptidase, MEROPS family A24B [Methanococcus maripaludis C5]|uniref:Preflagellin peptidase, Aspartic peptidase, MEROPS family A24B n=1 Tax=Methanococcus maripaludis (strain C5 / ATCC BAA-1333) TaxID=402880 RepID=A4FYS3_METM5|nr:preflagellin peptidase FlaK [Methanococcus maripaludis]ABO35357.1 preflagellin peptidase, Aspartic peptidase, MEROPS family A24B [Methanococcus maripaludis C5]